MESVKNIIHIEDLSFSYAKQTVLDGVCVSFKKAKLSMILGRNGSGKSTLFSLMSGLEKQYTGSIFFGDKERRQIKFQQNEQLRIGFLTQFHQTTFPFKVFDVVLTGRASFSRFAPTQIDHDIVHATLESFGLLHLKEKAYTTLSGGERQLILLCRVLVQQPDVLLLDEPTNHLDLHYQVLVLKAIKQLVDQGTTVLCVMHDPNLAMLFGDCFYLMQDHKLVDVNDASSQELLQLLQQTYQLELNTLAYQDKYIIVPQI